MTNILSLNGSAGLIGVGTEVDDPEVLLMGSILLAAGLTLSSGFDSHTDGIASPPEAAPGRVRDVEIGAHRTVRVVPSGSGTTAAAHMPRTGSDSDSDDSALDR